LIGNRSEAELIEDNPDELFRLKGLSVYFEASFWDLYMFSQFDNSNNSYLNLWNTTTFGLGAKVFFGTLSNCY